MQRTTLTFRYVESPPPPGLADLVAQYWEVHGSFPHVHEKVLPSSDIIFLVNLGAPHRLLGAAGDRLYSRAWVSGLQQSYLLTEALGPTAIWGARLTPRGTQAAFGRCADFVNEVAEIDEAIGRPGIELAERLGSAAGFVERCALFSAFLWRSLSDRPRRWPGELDHALAMMRVPGSALVGEIAAELGWSRKHLYSQFGAHVGLSPKAMSRIVRFETALRLIGPHEEVDLAGTAVAAGYYDQSQFTREFRRFAGETPTAYLRNRVAGSSHGFAEADG